MFNIVNRELLIGQAPQLLKATSSYCVEGRLKVDQNDTIAIIDGRSELTYFKGQNQRTFEIGTFPRNILEVLRFNRQGTLSNIRPNQSSQGSTRFPGFLDTSYNAVMRNKSINQVPRNHRQQRTVSEHITHIKGPKIPANKQFR